MTVGTALTTQAPRIPDRIVFASSIVYIDKTSPLGGEERGQTMFKTIWKKMEAMLWQ
jgi:hypothetical protein